MMDEFTKFSFICLIIIWCALITSIFIESWILVIFMYSVLVLQIINIIAQKKYYSKTIDKHC